MNLILPVAGGSTRFPGTRPKWLLTHPRGNLMVFHAIKGFKLEEFETIYLVGREDTLTEDIERGIYLAYEAIGYKNRFKIVKISPTQSQPETIANCIMKEKIEGPIFIKDCDNFFSQNEFMPNSVSFAYLDEVEYINPGSKSYISLDERSVVTNIVEKHVISNSFNVGGYCFQNARQFLSTFEEIKSPNIYISHIIYKMILEGTIFRGIPTTNFLDWGTLEDWNKFKRRFKTIFIDLDGVLLINAGEFFHPDWTSSKPIKENIDFLNSMDREEVQIIITTTRPERFRKVTLELIQKYNIPYDDIIFGLVHAERILINDYASTNPYPSALAVNIRRDSNNLKDYIK